MTFKDFNFSEQLTEGIQSMGYTTPTAIQQQAIPIILEGKDIIACAQTGTGKTASYLLPVLSRISQTDQMQINTLILGPTRELVQQIDQQVEGLAYFANISSLAVFGGGDGIAYEQQKRGIQNKVDIVIATPGRLISFLTSGSLKLDHLEHFILDEADRMLDMGFFQDIMRIITYLPAKRQTLMFSATMPGKIRTLARSILKDPAQVNISLSQPAKGIAQQIYRIHDSQKTHMMQIILKSGYKSAIIFASTKEKVKALAKDLKAAGVNVEAFHSDINQSEREEILLNFKNRKLPFIIGTDALSRGIDVEGIDLVVNYDVPGDPEDYIHRIGRTARAETTGTAITLVNHHDERKLTNIQSLIDKQIEEMILPAELGEVPKDKPQFQNNRKGRSGSSGGNRNNKSNNRNRPARNA